MKWEFATNNWIQILINRIAYLGLSIIEIAITAMHEFWYDYVKPKYREKAKVC